MLYKRLAVLGIVALLIFAGVGLKNCRGLLAPAPLGIHGHYSLDTDVSYTIDNTTVDTFLGVFSKQGFVVRNQYTGWRYLVGNIPCDQTKIEAYIEFDTTTAVASFKVLWLNAEPTEDDEEYKRLAKTYFDCFDTITKVYDPFEHPL